MLLRTYYLKYLLSTELRFDATLYSRSTNENSDACYNQCSRGLHLARGSYVPHPAREF